jgi:hypothetical protein
VCNLYSLTKGEAAIRNQFAQRMTAPAIDGFFPEGLGEVRFWSQQLQSDP